MYFPLDEVLMGWMGITDYDEKEKEENDEKEKKKKIDEYDYYI